MITRIFEVWTLTSITCLTVGGIGILLTYNHPRLEGFFMALGTGGLISFLACALSCTWYLVLCS